MNRRSFFQSALSTFGVLGVARVLGVENVFAAAAGKAPAVKARAGGAKTHAVMATDDSLKGLPKATNLSDANFWTESDSIATVQNYCDASIAGNKKCSDKRQPNQFCGSCTFLQERANYQGNVVGKCQLIQPKAPKDHVPGNFHCASYVNNAANKYEIKA
jgi:hypothetical protein